MEAIICGTNPIPALALWTGVYAVIYIPASLAWRKEGVTAGMLFWAGSRAAVRPASYFRQDRVRALTTMNVLFAAGWLAGLAAWTAQGLLCGP